MDLVGHWVARLSRPSGTVDIGLYFTGNGVAFLVAGAHGAGTWHAESGRIGYQIKEAILDELGDNRGYVDVTQQGSVAGDHLESTGEARVFGVDGSLVRVVPSQVTAVRKATREET
jgi:hypothetical protein